MGSKLSFWGNESFTPVFYLNATTQSVQNNFTRGFNRGFDWNLENTISYTRTINDHNFTALLGQGAYYDNRARGLTVTYFDLPVDNFDDASLNYIVSADQKNSTGYENVGHTVSSLFARLNYNFKEKYLIEGLIRRDGSSRFGANNKYGIFPSFSAGWVLTKEDFLADNTFFDLLKIRGGYGVVGNDNIGDFAYLSTIGGGRNYTIGLTDTYTVGYSPNAPSNPDLKWEQTSQTNIGVEMVFLNNFNLTFDWYNKVTTGILQNPPNPSLCGRGRQPCCQCSRYEKLGYRTGAWLHR